MPELPEVETVRKQLQDAVCIDKKISKIHILCPRLLGKGSGLSCLYGKKILDIKRHGKWLCAEISDGLRLRIHLRMTGQFILCPLNEPLTKHIRASIDFDDGTSLRFHDTRRFGTFDLFEKNEEVFANLGPEPFDLCWDDGHWVQLLKEQKRPIKAVLLDQSKIAGIGNIYADESLWHAEIHPLKPACSILQPKSQNLLASIRYNLKEGILHGGTSLGHGSPNFHQINGNSGKHQNSLNVYGRAGLPCLRCGAEILKIVAVQRGTHLCPSCQSLR